MVYKKSFFAVLVSMSLVACGGGSKNAAPTFNQTSYSYNVNEDSVIQGQLHATDADNDPLSYSVTVTTNNGLFTINPIAGTFAYTPNANFFGNDFATVQVSDGTHFTNATVNFVVAPINDAPTYVSHSLESGEEGTINGQIIAQDLEGDAITFSLVNQPELGTVDLQNDGSFVYTPNDLTLIDDSFLGRLSDGQSSTDVSIALVSQYTTNLDKLSYYYASEHSHVKQAETIAASLADSQTTDDIYSNLAVAYYRAGFTERAQSFIDNLISQNAKQAESLRNLADVEVEKGNIEKAKDYYIKAFELYNQTVAEKGYINITANDASFYQTLSRRLLDINDLTQSRKVAEQLIYIADAIKTPIYSTAYGRISTSFGNLASAEVNNWLTNKTPENYAQAAYAIEKMGYLAENTGYQVLSGYSVTNLKTLNLISTANLYFLLGDSDNSKRFTAKAFADYNYFENEVPTYRSLDPLYDVPQGLYAQNTVHRYPAGLASLIGIVAANFGEKHLYVKELLTKYGTASQNNNASINSQVYLAFNRLKNGEAVSAVLTDLKSTIPSHYDYFSILLDYSGDNLAMLLKSHGLDAEATAVANAAVDVFRSSAYQDEVLSNYARPQLYTIGSRGCIALADNLDIIVGNHDGLAAICQSHFELFSPALAKVTTVQTLDAYRAAVLMFDALNMSFDKVALSDTLVINSALVADNKTRMYETAQSAASLAIIGQFDEARLLVADVFDTLYTYTVNAEYGSKPADLNTVVGYIASYLGQEYSGSYAGSDYPTVLSSFRSQAHLGNNAAQLQNLNSQLSAQLARLDTAFNALSANEQQTIAEKRLAANLSGGREDLAKNQVNSSITAPANKLTLTRIIAIHTALLDHFPQTDVASVDTDHDGKPNFFAPVATETQIAESGLTLDDDADNDTVLDPNDKSPLDPTKH